MSGSLAPDHPVIVTISGVEHKPGQRKAFFRDTRAVLSELPRQPGLLGYSYKFQLIGNKAWTQTAWVDEAARDGFAKSRTHRSAVQNSRQTSQKARFVTVTRPLSSLPMRWSEALELIQTSDERTDD
jgi:heme-degrading monooxygenase HmoA